MDVKCIVVQHTLNNSSTKHKRQIYLTKNIQHKIKENNAIITKADKGKTLVIIYTKDYFMFYSYPYRAVFREISCWLYSHIACLDKNGEQMILYMKT